MEDFEDEVLNRRDFEVVERDEDMNLGEDAVSGRNPDSILNDLCVVERGEYSTFDLITRNEEGDLGQSYPVPPRDRS